MTTVSSCLTTSAHALGRITSTPAGTLTYTDQDLPKRFVSTTGASTDYVYDAFRGGVKKTLSGGGEEIALAGLFRRVKQGTSTTYEHALLVEGQVVGTIEHRSTGGAYANLEFYNRNQVGTVSAVAANTAPVVRAGTRDPFGNLVSGVPFLPGDTAGVGGGGFHGFQQQRHDLRAGLIDMNGRYYNARIGRFMSDDPVIADATDGRSYSAKTFVLNNPARLTDPTGYDPCNGDMQTDCKDGKGGFQLVPGDSPSSWENTKHYYRVAKNFAKDKASDFGDWVYDSTGTVGHWLNKTFNPNYSEPRGPSVPSAPGTPVAGSGNATTVVRGAGSPHTAIEATTGPSDSMGDLQKALIDGRITASQAADLARARGVQSVGDIGVSQSTVALTQFEQLVANQVIEALVLDVAGPTGGGGAAEGASGAARGASGETFEIIDGVRRAKAAEMLGRTTIPAEVQVGGRTVGRIDVPIDALRSPKSTIDVSNFQKAQRFGDTLQRTQGGSVPPPIQITPGTVGTPIPDVGFRY